MSTIGKALIVAQLAFSVLLMAFAAGVSSVQTNWKKEATKLAADLKKANDSGSQLRADIEKEKTASTAAEKTLKDAANKAQGQADQAKGKIKQLELQLTQTRTELQNVSAEAKIAGEEARARRDEAVSLRTINSQLHQKHDELIAANRDQADKIVNLQQDERTMVQKQNQTLKDYALLQKFIRVKGFKPDPKELVGIIEPPPVVDGVVLNTMKGNRNGSDLIEISLGSDAGLATGNELAVFRADGHGKYLGKIKLVQVDYRKAVGMVVESTKFGDIKRGDNVTTKL